MIPDEKIDCHRLVRKCRDGVITGHCQLWTSIKFRNPQSGEMTDRYGCADSFVPLLLIENSQMARQTGAAVESFRNEVAKANETAVRERNEALARFAAAGGPRLVGNPS